MNVVGFFGAFENLLTSEETMIATVERKTKLPAAGRGRLKIPKAKKNANAPCEEAAIHEGSGPTCERVSADIEVDRIVRCEFQPRQDFPENEIRELANSIAEQGQIHPIAVRVSDPGVARDPANASQFELVDGERRWRAVQLLGWKTIRAEIAEYTDAQVRAIVLATALQRKELNAIEEARAFRAAIDAGDAAGPTELAKQLGVSQGHVSNRLRLLELPESSQALVISREMSASNARTLAAYAAIPGVCKEVEKELKDWKKQAWHDPEPTTEDFADIVGGAVGKATRPLEGKEWSSKLCKQVSIFKPTDQQREQLGIVSLRGEKGEAEEVATNVELWKKLQAEHEARLAEKANNKMEGGRGKGEKKKPLTAAEQKQAAEEEKQREKDRAAKLAEGIYAVAIDWRRWLIAEALRHENVSPEDTFRLLLYFAASRSWHRGTTFGLSMAIERYDLRELILWNGLSAAGSRVPCKGGLPDLLAALGAFEDRFVIDRAQEFLARMFWDDEETRAPQVIPDADVLAIAEQLAIDLAAAWKKEAAGPLTERWLNLRNKEGLEQLAGEWGVQYSDGFKKADFVGFLAKIATKAKLPAELLKPKKPKER